MIYLAHRLTRADVLAVPGRTAAVAGLLVAAAWLPAAVDTQLGYGMALAAAVAFCATLGVVSLEADRSRLLEENGARPRALAAVAAASMVPPAVLATLVALGLGLVLPSGPATLAVVLAALVVPVVTALVAVWVAGRAAVVDAGGPVRRARRAMRVVAGVVLVVLLISMPLFVVPLVGLRLSAGAWSTTRARRAAGGLLALLVVGAIVVTAGSSTTWFDLALVLLLAGPSLVVSCVVLGMHAVALGAGLAGRVGPRARLALAPLVGRRRALAPLMGVIAFVAALAVHQAVVGASFGEREANRERDLPTVVADAGNRADQAIAVVPPVDPASLRARAAEVVAGTGATAVVVEQVGFGAPVSFSGLFGFVDLATTAGGGVVLATDTGIDQPPGGAGWVGVVAPADLAALGWASSAPDLEAGRLVLTAREQPDPGGVADVLVFGDLRELPASAAGAASGALLPGAIVSDAVASQLTPVRTAARIVVVPTPGAAAPPSEEELRRLAGAIRSEALALPPIDTAGLTADQQMALQLQTALTEVTGAAVYLGRDPVVISESGPLNDVPSFARTAEEGRSLLLAQAALALVMTVAGVLLALGATRSDDVVLEVQGAPTGLRSTVSAIQAAVIAGAASVFAALAGIGVPAAAFATYNGREAELPDIPLVIPGVVWAVLVALPVLAAAVSAAIPAARRPAGPDRLLALGS